MGAVADHQVNLQVNRITHLAFAQRRHFLRVRNNIHRKVFTLDLINGQRYAVERHRAFVGNESA